jgi:hypothetical protein
VEIVFNRFDSKTSSWKGGETMKKFALALVMLLVLAGSASAVTVEIELYRGANIMALPNAPFEVGHYDASWETFFYNPYYIFKNKANGEYADPVGGGLVVEGNLYKYDPTTKSGMLFSDDWSMLLGEGYVYNSPNRFTITYEGIPDGIPDNSGDPETEMTDMLIPLPGAQNDTATEPNPLNLALSGGGRHLIGCPYAHMVPVAVEDEGDNIWFTDGTVRKTWAQAAADKWVANLMEGRDASTKSAQLLSLDGAGGDLMPGRGYWIRTYKDNISMIIPAYPNNGDGPDARNL